MPTPSHASVRSLRSAEECHMENSHVKNRISMASAPGTPSLASLVGDTPVLWIPELWAGEERGFWAKLERYNPGGIKDRPGLHMIEQTRLRGELEPGQPVIESTSGTLRLGLALAGVTYRHPVILVSNPGMEPLIHRPLRAYGAHVETVVTPHPAGGWQEARRRRVRELLDEHPDAYCPDPVQQPG
ncbi:pyridoxal-phosphate dependent enzyme [Streptosporangium canum]|uniref:pyridoxal-phosphate dependent enzyme n=1 Tax=Streptosporangium canum TaxID=324952 RepID=UPI0036801E71